MDDLIRRQDAIDAIYDGTPPEPHYPAWYVERIRAIPRAARTAVKGLNDKITGGKSKVSRIDSERASRRSYRQEDTE